MDITPWSRLRARTDGHHTARTLAAIAKTINLSALNAISQLARAHNTKVAASEASDQDLEAAKADRMLRDFSAPQPIPEIDPRILRD